MSTNALLETIVDEIDLAINQAGADAENSLDAGVTDQARDDRLRQRCLLKAKVLILASFKEGTT